MNILYMESYKILKLKCDSRLNFYKNISINFNEPTNTITETCQTHELPQNIKKEYPGHLTSAGQGCVLVTGNELSLWGCEMQQTVVTQ